MGTRWGGPTHPCSAPRRSGRALGRCALRRDKTAGWIQKFRSWILPSGPLGLRNCTLGVHTLEKAHTSSLLDSRIKNQPTNTLKTYVFILWRHPLIKNAKTLPKISQGHRRQAGNEDPACNHLRLKSHLIIKTKEVHSYLWLNFCFSRIGLWLTCNLNYK